MEVHKLGSISITHKCRQSYNVTYTWITLIHPSGRKHSGRQQVTCFRPYPSKINGFYRIDLPSFRDYLQFCDRQKLKQSTLPVIQYLIMNKEILEDLMIEIVDEVSLGLCFEMHRSCKRGIFLLDEMDSESQKMYEIVNERGLDVFGQVPSMKKQYDCTCPNCHRNMAASRFAPHLEKCMGMGASVPRVASRRIASHTKKESEIESDDNSEDNDWTYSSDRKAKKFKKEKKSFKKSRTQLKPSLGKSPSVGCLSPNDTLTQTIYEKMSLNEKKDLLQRTCGVISEHTKKMCTRSLHCPQHTDGQRRVVRDRLLDNQLSQAIDVDSSWSQDMRGKPGSTGWEAISKYSPAGSSSTITSCGSTKKLKRSKMKRKRSSSYRATSSESTK